MGNSICTFLGGWQHCVIPSLGVGNVFNVRAGNKIRARPSSKSSIYATEPRGLRYHIPELHATNTTHEHAHGLTSLPSLSITDCQGILECSRRMSRRRTHCDASCAYFTFIFLLLGYHRFRNKFDVFLEHKR